MMSSKIREACCPGHAPLPVRALNPAPVTTNVTTSGAAALPIHLLTLITHTSRGPGKTKCFSHLPSSCRVLEEIFITMQQVGRTAQYLRGFARVARCTINVEKSIDPHRDCRRKLATNERLLANQMNGESSKQFPLRLVHVSVR